MIERLVVPTDGSEHAAAALEHAAAIAAARGATAHVVHVATDSLDPEEDPRIEHILTEAQSWFEDADATVTTAIRAGPPAKNVLEYAAEVDADAIVLGTPSRSGVKRVVLGSVTERVVRDAERPVLVVPPTEEAEHAYPYRTVLAATDGSEHATRAVKRTVELASPTVRTVHLLCIVDVSPVNLDEREDVQVEPFEAAARSVVREAAEVAQAAGAEDVVTSVAFGSARQEILAYADAHDVDLVGVGTSGRGGLDRVLLGSVAEGVLRASPRPVLTVRADSELE